MKTYIYTGNDFPSNKGKKVSVVKELGDKVQVKVMDESKFVEGLGVWGIAFYCKIDELEEAFI